MLNEQVGEMEPMDRLIYWIKERHQIYLKRLAKRPKPWTDDEVLQKYFFTNPYRENDKTTQWFRRKIRDPLANKPEVLFATVAFRWFNLIATGEILLKAGLLNRWNEQRAVQLLRQRNDGGNVPVFTGAFMIKAGNGPPGCKIPLVCECITAVWEDNRVLATVGKQGKTMKHLWERLKEYRGLGPFMSYEIVCDLRYTKLLEDATDVDTWCNVGPGASRGLNRLNGIPIKMAAGGTKDSGRKPPKDWQPQMVKLLATVRKRLPKMPHFEMREIEMSLCEFDKYERLLWNQGRSKRLYDGMGE